MNEIELTPKQIVAELDKYIVGQGEAKKSVAIALRNRWRRKHLTEDLQREIIPKNILLSVLPASVRPKSPAVWLVLLGRLSSRSKRRSTPKSAM